MFTLEALASKAAHMTYDNDKNFTAEEYEAATRIIRQRVREGFEENLPQILFVMVGLFITNLRLTVPDDDD